MSLPGAPVVIGYHGCDRKIGLKLISGEEKIAAEPRPYHWLGHGVYFWENDYDRALEWATEKAQRNEIEVPFVIGAAINLGRCLDFYVRENQELLIASYNQLVAEMKATGSKMPKNKTAKHNVSGTKVRQFLDCAVINNIHEMDPKLRWDTIRGLFVEGDPLYPDAGLYNKTHSEIAVCNLNCIVGLFLPADR